MNMREQIEKEIEDSIANEKWYTEARYGSDWKRKARACGYFNNFYGNLPGGYRRNYENILDLPNEEGHRKGQTLREFFQEIDTTITESRTNPSIVEELQTRLKESGDSLNAFDSVLEVAFPVYVRMREKGYTKFDLTA